jgi:hypothetical protein
MAAGSPAGQVIASIEGAGKIEFATLRESRGIGAIGPC